MKLMNTVKRFGQKYGRATATVALVAVAGPTFAAEGDIDTTKVLLYIAGGVVAATAIGAAMMGLVALIGVSKKAQRAGT